MIITVEGCSGSGKSTVAAELSQSLGFPVFRMLDRVEDRVLEGVIPLNTYHEDAYAMDALARLRADVVCDRFMPSALAWTDDDALPRARQDALMQWWSERMAGANGVLICLMTDVKLAAGRSRHGHGHGQVAREQEAIAGWSRKATALGVPVAFIPNDSALDMTVQAALAFVRRHRR